MDYLRHISVAILSGFIIILGCSNNDQQTIETANNSEGDQSNVSTNITTQTLIKASFDGNLDTVRKAVEQGVDVDSQDQSGRTPLMMAAFNGHYELVQYLLENGADPNTVDRQGRTPLIFATSGPYAETVRLLLDNGAKPNKTDQNEKWSPLMWAAAEGNEEVVKVLLDHGADPTLQDTDNETARDFASSNGHGKIVKLLKEAENER